MNCPIINTHKRLNEIHRLWHQCLENYFDPEGYRTNLNAAIQALRNLTFALQNEKNGIPDFENWYSKWQQKMKDDEVLSWLNNARVKIVHQKDLETQSIIKVTVKNYLNVAEFELELPPFTPTSLIGAECVKSLSEFYPLEHVRECYAIIERKWVEKELNNWELLDALSYGFSFLYKIVVEAHEKAGIEFINCHSMDSLHRLEVPELLEGNFNCMKQKEHRTAIITLSDFENVEYELRKVIYDEKLARKSVKRYNPPKISFEGKQIIDHAREINEVAKRVLVKDKHHSHMFMFRLPSNNWEIMQAEVIDKTSKFLLMNRIGEIVDKKDINAVINISEVWVTHDIDAVITGKKVADAKDKTEALLVTLIINDGTQLSFYTRFKRNITGKIILEKTIESTTDGLNFLTPIFEIWNKKTKKSI